MKIIIWDKYLFLSNYHSLSGSIDYDTEVMLLPHFTLRRMQRVQCMRYSNSRCYARSMTLKANAGHLELETTIDSLCQLWALSSSEGENCFVYLLSEWNKVAFNESNDFNTIGRKIWKLRKVRFVVCTALNIFENRLHIDWRISQCSSSPALPCWLEASKCFESRRPALNH